MIYTSYYVCKIDDLEIHVPPINRKRGVVSYNGSNVQSPVTKKSSSTRPSLCY